MRKAHQKTWTLDSGEDLQPRHTLFKQAYTHLQLGEMISLDHWLRGICGWRRQNLAWKSDRGLYLCPIRIVEDDSATSLGPGAPFACRASCGSRAHRCCPHDIGNSTMISSQSPSSDTRRYQHGPLKIIQQFDLGLARDIIVAFSVCEAATCQLI